MSESNSRYSVDYVFTEVQYASKSNNSYAKMLTNIYQKSELEDFLSSFIKCLKICLMHDEKSHNVEITLDFAAKFVVSFSADLGDEECCPLLEAVFQFIFENHNSQIQLVRLRICRLMNRLLDNMGHEATVLEDTYSKIAENMLMRLQDSMTSVRTQAVYALHRLQAPSDPQCEITKAFIYHMTHDPCYEVRKAIIQKIAVNKATLSSILTRMNDVKDIVRKEAYMVINRFLIKQFTTKQRQLILECGLGDRSDLCREYVTDVLLPGWLKYFDSNYYNFLECIHVEKNPELGIKVLKTLFKKQHDVVLETRAKDMGISDKIIPYDKLNEISVVFWRALAEYVRPTDQNDKYEQIFHMVLPDLTPFCQYIREYFFPPEKPREVSLEVNNQSPVVNSISLSSIIGKNEPNRNESGNGGAKAISQNPTESVLVHLLEMCKVYDLADEMGRLKVRELCVEFLQSDIVKGESVAVLAGLLNHVIPSVNTKLSVMAEIISELREPLQNDQSVYEPDLLLIEAEDKKYELREKITELDNEIDNAEELGDTERVAEIKKSIESVKKELKMMMTATPNEFGRHCKTDPVTLRKCVTIVVEIMKSGKVKKMNPTLYSLMQNFIIPTFKLEIQDEGASMIKNLSMQALGIFCILDMELAKEQFVMFCFNIANEMLCVTALKCLYDLLHVYGLSTFDIENPYEGDIQNKENIVSDPSRPNLIHLLVSLLNSQSVEMRKTSVIGLSKLLLSGRVKSPVLVSKLILLWFNPAFDNDPHVRQVLGVFFQVFASQCPHGPELLLRAFMPTVKELFKLEITDPMTEVDVESVANLMADLLQPEVNAKICKDVTMHNQLGITICEELLKEEYEGTNCTLLLKVMSHLEFNYQNTTDITILTALITRLTKELTNDKTSHRLAVKLGTLIKVQSSRDQSVATVCNTLSPNSTLNSVTTDRSIATLLVSNDGWNSQSESDEESEKLSDLSPDLTIKKSVNFSENMVISSTSDSSDSESSESSGSPSSKSMKMSPEFKHPEKIPSTPFKVPTKTPKKTSKTPAKQAPVQEGENLKTPAKPPSKLTRSSGRTPGKNLKIYQTPERNHSVQVSTRVTRSATKRKS